MCLKCYCWSDTGGSGYLRDRDCLGKPSSSYTGLHTKVVDRREHPSQIKKHKVHAIIAIDKDPWTWRKLRNVQEVAQEGPDGGKRVRFTSTCTPQQQQRVWDAVSVNPQGGRLTPGSCSTLVNQVRPPEGSSSQGKGIGKRNINELELEVLPPDSGLNTVRKPKSARNV